MQPIYKIIAMTGTILVVWLGGRNVLGEGWQVWDIAAFSTYLSCFVKMSIKTSHAARLFNAVQKAQVSWGRIQPRLAVSRPCRNRCRPFRRQPLRSAACPFPMTRAISRLSSLSFSANPGDIIGITGPVACGKSTLALPSSVKNLTAAKSASAPVNWETAIPARRHRRLLWPRQ